VACYFVILKEGWWGYTCRASHNRNSCVSQFPNKNMNSADGSNLGGGLVGSPHARASVMSTVAINRISTINIFLS